MRWGNEEWGRAANIIAVLVILAGLVACVVYGKGKMKTPRAKERRCKIMWQRTRDAQRETFTACNERAARGWMDLAEEWGYWSASWQEITEPNWVIRNGVKIAEGNEE